MKTISSKFDLTHLWAKKGPELYWSEPPFIERRKESITKVGSSGETSGKFGRSLGSNESPIQQAKYNNSPYSFRPQMLRIDWLLDKQVEMQADLIMIQPRYPWIDFPCFNGSEPIKFLPNEAREDPY